MENSEMERKKEKRDRTIANTIEGNKAEGNRLEGSRQERDKAEGNKPESSRQERDKAEGNKPESSRQERDKAEGNKPEGSSSKGAAGKKVKWWESYLSKEIIVDFKSTLYFFCILFFYSMVRIAEGSLQANIVHMAEMIAATYFMCYVQLLFLDNFDEGERFGGKAIFYSLCCSLAYTVTAALCGWYGENGVAKVLFFLFMELCYISMFLSYKMKRNIETRILNNDLRAFQERKGGEE